MDDRRWHSLTPAAVGDALDVDPTRGLSAAEAARRLVRHGPNATRERPPAAAIGIWVDQFRSAVVLLLAAAGALSAMFGEWPQVAAIGAVLLINALVGFVTELRATRAMEALRALGADTARVRRDGRVAAIAAADLVPGDIVLLDGGDIVPADVRLVQAASLACDESALTGESVPVDKAPAPVAEAAVLPDRASMAYKGTAVARGTAEAIVVGTGSATEIGRIATLVEEAEPERSPLERRLARLSQQLIWVTLALAAIIVGAGVAAGEDVVLMAEAGIALAVAAIPEGLPVVATLALARGMLRMARANALVERLSAVETLGATTVILTDKTGTLTENRMVVDRLVLPAGEVAIDYRDRLFLHDGAPVGPRLQEAVETALRIGVLCTNASYDPEFGTGTGDPTEIAFLHAGHLAGLEREACLTVYPEVAEYAFDSASKRMATVHGSDERYLIAVKGAPESVLPECDAVLLEGAVRPLDEAARARWAALADDLAHRGLRMLALACKPAESPATAPYPGLTFVGLAALHDPPRSDVGEAIRACQDAGITVVMVTGDHAGTARSISHAVGLADRTARVITGGELAPLATLPPEARRDVRETAVFARVSPEQKLGLIRLFQQAGEVVAMTGDGVNDAPALRQADIGIAMGLRGTQVAREAADIVLRDDAFPTIVAAIREGRIIFGNIRRFATYLLSCNLSEVLIVGLGVIAGLPLPLLPLQILFLNLVTDVFPAFALGLGEGRANVMDQPPRPPREGILAGRQWRQVVGYGGLITAATLGALVVALELLALTPGEAVSISFLTLALAQLWHVFNMRADTAPLWRNDIVGNPYVWGALVLCTALLLLATYLPALAAVLSIVPPSADGWLLVLGASAVPVVGGEIFRLGRRILHAGAVERERRA
ncbi:MAG: cation-transporting P-type ATPase [Alphaproteobacteria bacterium]